MNAIRSLVTATAIAADYSAGDDRVLPHERVLDGECEPAAPQAVVRLETQAGSSTDQTWRVDTEFFAPPRLVVEEVHHFLVLGFVNEERAAVRELWPDGPHGVFERAAQVDIDERQDDRGVEV